MLGSSSSTDPFAGLSAVLAAAPVNVDPHRQRRKGVPEVVYAAGKPPRLVLAAVRKLLEVQARVLVSRASTEVVDLLRTTLEAEGASVLSTPSGVTLLVCRADAAAGGAAEHPPETGGVVGLLTAGASDAPSADEAAWVARE